jgi:hypothetical protein
VGVWEGVRKSEFHENIGYIGGSCDGEKEVGEFHNAFIYY